MSTVAFCLMNTLLALVVFTGCATGKGAEPGPTSVPAGPVQPKVNRLVMATSAPFAESNLTGALIEPTLWPLRPMYESLIAVDPQTAKLMPQLAAEWQLEPDGASFRFKLRRGVIFHKDYGEFTAKDLVPPWQERVRDGYAFGLTIHWRAFVKDIETVSDYEAIYRLNRPDGLFLSIYASEQTDSMQIWSKAHLQAKGPPTMQTEPLAGTGPYQFKERKEGQFVRFERVAFKHWRITPDFPEFEFRWAKEASTRLAALLAKEIQIADLPQDLKTQAEKQGFKIVRGRVPGLRTFISFYCCNLKDINNPSLGYMYPDSPLMEVRVRKALSKAINRDELNKAFFGGKAEEMVLSHFHPTRAGWNPDWEKRYKEEYGYDPDKAKALLAEAGYGPGNPLRHTILVSPAAGYSGAEDMAEAIAAKWRAVGITVELLPRDPASITGDRVALRYNNHTHIQGTGSDLWSGSSNFSSVSLGPRGGGVDLLDADLLMRQIATTTDIQKQDELWRKTGDILFNQFNMLPLFWLPVEAVVDPIIVAEWLFPGAISGSWTHVPNVKAAP